MELTTSHLIQLIIALFLGIILFATVNILPDRIIVSLLILIIPFQIIDSHYGSINMVFIYMAGIAFFLKKKLKFLPLKLPLFLLITAYFLSITQVHRSTLFDHTIYLISIGSNFILFYIIYNFIRDAQNPRFVLDILVVLNVMFIFYCFFQLLIGFERFTFLGIEEFSFIQNRSDLRLGGPFRAVGITAEYLVIQIIILWYYILFTQNQKLKILYIITIALNFAFLVATANRGGFISLIIGIILFFYIFRKYIRFSGMLLASILIPITFSIISFLIITYTPYNLLYDRLFKTEFVGAIPDTRSYIWPTVWKEIEKKPILGHGPRFRLYNEEERDIPGKKFIPYPHSLVLFILYTIGVFGLLAYLVFGAALGLKMLQATHVHNSNTLLKEIPKLGILIFAIFLVDQLKVSFFRYLVSDFQHYIFMLFGMLVGFSDLLTSKNLIRQN